MLTAADRAGIEEIAQAIREKKLVLFIGAGISKNADFLTWGQLLNELKSEVFKLLDAEDSSIEKDKAEIDNVLKVLLDDNLSLYEEAAEYLLKHFGRDDYATKVVGGFYQIEKDKLTENINGSKVFTKIKDLYDSGVNKIVTTNYDNCIEELLGFVDGMVTNGCENENILHEVALRDEFFVKLHGTAGGGSIIFTKSEYRDHYSVKTNIPDFLYEIFSHYTVLFIGCSMTDRYVEVIKKLSNQNKLKKVYFIGSKKDINKSKVSFNACGAIEIENYKEGLLEFFNSLLDKVEKKKEKEIYNNFLDNVSKYDFITAETFFSSMANDNTKACFFYNTQVDSLDWFRPMLNIHLSKQGKAKRDHDTKKEKKMSVFRIIFSTQDELALLSDLRKDSKRLSFLKALAEIHKNIETQLAIITIDQLANIILEEDNKSFFEDEDSMKQLGLTFDTKQISSDVEKLKEELSKSLKQQVSGYKGKKDLDFSIIKRDKDSESETWQANMSYGKLKYSKCDETVYGIYSKFSEIIEKSIALEKNEEIKLKDVYTVENYLKNV